MERFSAMQTNAKQIAKMKKIRVCFLRLDGALVDALRVIEITTAANTKGEAMQRLIQAAGQWIGNT